MPYDDMPDFYAAYRRFAEIVEDPSMEVTFKLRPGELFIVAAEVIRLAEWNSSIDPSFGPLATAAVPKFSLRFTSGNHVSRIFPGVATTPGRDFDSVNGHRFLRLPPEGALEDRHQAALELVRRAEGAYPGRPVVVVCEGSRLTHVAHGVIAPSERLAFAERAVAYETVSPSEQAEFQRKVRIATRGLYGLWVARELLDPLRFGFYAVQLASHKLLRWSVCWLLLVVFGLSLALYGEGGLPRLLAQAQLAFYACALAAMALRHSALARHRAFKLFGIPFYFCLANYAALRAYYQSRYDYLLSVLRLKAAAGGGGRRFRPLEKVAQRHELCVPAASNVRGDAAVGDP